MTILADTNTLLRWAQPRALDRSLAIAAVKALRTRGEAIVISPQNIVEFWSVTTRAVTFNGLGFSLERADRVARRLERLFRLVPDTPAIHTEWRQLVVTLGISGRQVYDARLAAVMRAHGIDRILTFNTADFLRYPGITAVHPRDVVATP